MTSITPTDTSMTTALSAPPADLCPDLELVIPATPEQSPRTERPSDVPQGTMNAPATSRARICRVEKALPLSGMSQKTVAPSLGSCQIHKQKTCRKQGECRQYQVTHLRSLTTLIYTLWGFVDLAEDADARNLEPSGIDMHEQGGALPVAGAAPAQAESTAGVKSAGEAERAIAAKPEALASWTQGEAGREAESPPQEGEQELKAPLHKGRHKPEALP